MSTANHPHEILEEAAATLKQRGVDYDGKGYQGGERSMVQTLELFKALTGVQLSELDGWRFLICLKLARSTTGKPKRDTYVDLAGYAALAAETALWTETAETTAHQYYQGETIWQWHQGCPCIVCVTESARVSARQDELAQRNMTHGIRCGVVATQPVASQRETAACAYVTPGEGACLQINCTKHARVFCVNCGADATHGCEYHDIKNQIFCGANLCDKCGFDATSKSHTHRRNA